MLREMVGQTEDAEETMKGDVPESAGSEEARERRRHPRIALPAPVALSIHSRPTSTARLINISHSGVAVLADQLLGGPGEQLVVDGIGGERVTLPCDVRWALAEKDPLPTQGLRWLHGAAFGEMDVRARRFVGTLIRDAGRACAGG